MSWSKESNEKVGLSLIRAITAIFLLLSYENRTWISTTSRCKWQNLISEVDRGYLLCLIFLRLVCSYLPVNLYSLTPILFCLIARPFLVNELEPQYLLHDRRKVYEVLFPLENSFNTFFGTQYIRVFILWSNTLQRNLCIFSAYALCSMEIFSSCYQISYLL